MNNVELSGNLAKDPTTGQTADKKSHYARATLACNREGSNGGCDFISITAWNEQATILAGMKKGSRCHIKGSIRVDSSADKTRYYTKVVAREVIT